MVKRPHLKRRGLAFALSTSLLLGAFAGLGALAEQPSATTRAATPESGAAAPQPDTVALLLQGAYAYETQAADGDGSILASADAYIQKDDKGPMGATNAGSLQIKNADSAGYNRRALIRFDLTGHEEQLASAERVVLQMQTLYCDEDKYYGWENPETDQTRLVRIYDVDGDWDEATVLWSTAPEVTGDTPLVLDDTELRNGDIEGDGKCITLDVTDYVKNAGKTTFNFLLGIFNNGAFENGDNSGFAVASKENGGKAGPTLVLVYQTAVAKTELTVAQGETPALPATVAVTCSDGSTVQKAVTWQAYDPALLQTPGAFTVTGSVEGSALTAEATITVTAPLVNITAVTPSEPITALVGTPLDKLGLPETAAVTLENGETLTLPVADWTCEPAYDLNQARDYAFVDTLDLTGSGAANPEGLRPSVAVTLVHATDKNILTCALLEAQKAAENGLIDGLVPSVRAEFDQAAAQADAVYADEDADTAAVQQAYLALQQALWKLSYQKADKAALQAAMDQGSGMDLSGYTDASVQALNQAMTAARALLDNAELSVADQASLDAAAQTVRTAIAGLELVEQPAPVQPGKRPDSQPVDEHPEIGDAIANGTWGQPQPSAAPGSQPADGNDGVIPATADPFAPALWGVLTVVSAAGVCALLALRRRGSR